MSTAQPTILGICSSQRYHGNTAILLNELLRPAREKGFAVEVLALGRFKIQPCTGCFACNNRELKCVLKDDLELIKEKIAAADAIALASPTYYLSVPSTLKTILDRTAAWALDAMAGQGKPRFGAAVTVAGGRPDWFPLARPLASAFLGLYQCQIVGNLTIGEIAFKGEILLSPSRLAAVHELGAALVGSLESGRLVRPTQQADPERLVCPNCLSDVFQLDNHRRILCPVCNLELLPSRNPFRPGVVTRGTNRFTAQGAREHLDQIGQKILVSTQLAGEIEQRAQRYFAMDELPQTDYPYPLERAGEQHGIIQWTPEAIQAFEQQCPPAFQSFVRKAIEKKAAQKNLDTITREVFLEIKKESGN
jgi:multimeric flavodoxin WrbA